MQRHARATADDEHSPASPPQRREVLVTVLAVVAVTVTAVLAAVMHVPPDASAGAPRPALAVQADRASAACAECGVVEAVVPLGPNAAEAASAWQIRIRMDDGSVRTVEQRGALAAGSRVVVAGASVRVLSNRPGQG